MSTISNTERSFESEDRITTEHARMWLEFKLQTALKRGENTLIEAPTSLGKSHLVATTPWRDFPEVTGGQPVIHFHVTRKARDEAAAKSEAAGVEYAVLEGREDSCPVAEGKHDQELTTPDGKPPSEWFNQKCDVEGVRFSRAHSHLKAENDKLPCTPCDAVRQWRDVPRDENGEVTVDVIHATASFAQVDTLTKDANLIFDERPSFTESFGARKQDQLRRGFTRWLTGRADGSVTWEEFIVDVREADQERLREYRQMLQVDPSHDYMFGLNDSHQSAAAIGRALLNSVEWTNGRLVGWDRDTAVVLDDGNNLSRVHKAPPLTRSRCVIGLDAYPVEPLWRLNTVDDLTAVRVLSEEKQRSWRRNERGLEIIQVGEDANYVTRGWGSKESKKKAKRLIKALRKKHGKEFRTCICSKAIESDVKQFFEDAGIDDYVTMYLGNLKSRNDYEKESVGLVLGCIDPGDDYVLDMLALCGARAEPEPSPDGNGRALGRGFVGPDSDVAEEILASVQRDSVSQAVGRYARHPDDTDSGATVYTWTNVLPGTLTDGTVPGPRHKITKRMREIEGYVRENSPVTAKEVAENVEVSKKYAHDILGRMEEQGIVTRRKDEGWGGATVFKFIQGVLQRPVDLEL